MNTELQKLVASLNYTCTYYNHKCTYIPASINGFHKKGYKVDSEFLTAYLKKMTASGNNSYNSCMNQNTDWVSTIIDIIAYLVPTTEQMIMLISGYYKSGYATKTATNIAGLWKAIIKSVKEIPVSVFEAGIKVRNYDTLSIIVDYTKTTSKCIEELCLYSKSDYTIISGIIDRIFLQKIPITTIALNNAIKSGSIELAVSFLQKGVQPDNRSLVNACGTRDEKLIGMLLLCKLTPTKECFEALIPYNSSYSSEANKVANIIDSLIQHGYSITYEDVMFALEKRQHINNIRRFNIKFDNKIIEKCAKLGYYPYSEKDIGVKPTIECLRIECGKTGNIKTIKSLISSGLKPDIQCLRNACAVRSNITNIRFLIEKHGLKVDIECLKNMASTIGNKSLSYMLENVDFSQPSNKDVSKVKKVAFNKDDDIDFDEDNDVDDKDDEDNEISKPSNDATLTQIKQLENNKKTFKLSPYNYNQQYYRESNYGFIVKTLLDGAKVIIGIDRKNNGETNELADDERILAEELKKELGININENQPDNKNSQSNVFIIPPLTEDEFKKIDSRKKYGLTPEAAQIFGTKKTSKMSIVEVRNELTKYIIDHKLIDNKNKTLINLDDTLIKLLKTEKGKCIEFNNLDNLVHRLIKI